MLALFDDVNTSTRADVKLPMLRTSVSLDLALDLWEAARHALSACSSLLGAIPPPPNQCSIPLQHQMLGEGVSGVGLKSFLWILLASSDPNNFSTPSTVLMPFPDVPWKCAVTKDFRTLNPKRTNI